MRETIADSTTEPIRDRATSYFPEVHGGPPLRAAGRRQ
jgi:hypothetical protein